MANSNIIYQNEYLMEDNSDDEDIDSPYQVLHKATMDPFCYLLKLKSGDQILFSQATQVGPDWIHLTAAVPFGDTLGELENFITGECDFPDRNNSNITIKGRTIRTLPRGIDIRVSSIEWIIDAPFGS